MKLKHLFPVLISICLAFSPLSAAPVQAALPIVHRELFTTYDNLASARWADWNIVQNQLSIAKTSAWHRSGADAVLLPDGISYIGWQDTRERQNQLYLQKLDPQSNRLWSQDVRVHEDIPAAYRADLRIVPDMEGGVYTVFADTRSLSADPDQHGYHIFAQRISPEGQRRWAQDVWVRASTDVEQTAVSDFKATLTSNGNLAIFWQEGSLSDIDNAFYVQQYRPDGSAVWGAPVQILPHGAYQFPVTMIKALTSGLNGSLLVLWMNARPGQPNDLFGLWIEANGAPRTPNPVTYIAGGSFPKIDNVAAQPREDGSVYLAWQGHRSGTDTRDLYAQRFSAAGTPLWAAPVRVNASSDPDPGTRVQVMLDIDQNLMVWWGRDPNGWATVLQIISTTGQRMLSQERSLGGSTVPYPNWVIQDRLVLVEPQGEVLSTYLLGFGFDTPYLTAQRFTAQNTARGVFPQPVHDLDGTAAQMYPLAASTTDGATVLAWQSVNIDRASLHLQRYNASGQPQLNLATQLDAGDALIQGVSADLAVDGQNNAAVAWGYWTGDNRQVRVQKIAPDGKPIWAVDKIASTEDGVGMHRETRSNRVGVGADQQGNVYVTWSTSGNQILMQKYNPQGQAQWGSGKSAVTTPPNSAWILEVRDMPALDTSPDGTVTVAWHQYEIEPLGDGFYVEHSFIYAQRFSSSGSAEWDVDMQANHQSHSAGKIHNLFLDVEPTGGAYVLTNIEEPENNAAFVMRITPAGTRAWPADFRLTSPGRSTEQAALAAAPDGSAYLAWSSGAGIQVQRILPSGSLAWTSDALINGSYFRLAAPALTVNSAGSAAIAYQHLAEEGNADVYLSQVNAAGSLILDAVPAASPDRYYHPAAEVHSRDVAPTGYIIQAAKINADMETNGGSIRFFFTNTGGAIWLEVNPGIAYSLPGPTTDLRYKVVLQSDGKNTPVLHAITVTMYPSGPALLQRQFLPQLGR